MKTVVVFYSDKHTLTSSDLLFRNKVDSNSNCRLPFIIKFFEAEAFFQNFGKFETPIIPNRGIRIGYIIQGGCNSV